MFLYVDCLFSETNYTLRTLDLQWNHFRKESGKQLCLSMKVTKAHILKLLTCYQNVLHLVWCKSRQLILSSQRL